MLGWALVSRDAGKAGPLNSVSPLWGRRHGGWGAGSTEFSHPESCQPDQYRHHFQNK